MSKNYALNQKIECYHCHKWVDGFTYGVQIIRYGYSGGPINLCESCFREFKNWLETGHMTQPIVNVDLESLKKAETE